MTDRFNPHTPYNPYVDPDYPDATNTVDCFAVACTQEEQWRSYWGGDISGIVEKLDYLKRLGISAVWVTPLMENVRAYESGTGYGTGYHGYWVQNYYRVNPHFGNWDDINLLSRELHAREMHYIQDITLNHSNPNDNHVYGRLYQSTDSDRIFINSYNDDYDTTYGTRFYKHYNDDPRCQQVLTPIPPVPDYQWTYWQLHHCLLADLSGYNQRDPMISDYLIGAGKEWLSQGVDDFRLDAIKFVFPEFVSRFTHATIDYSKQMGRPAPYIVGEWSNGGVGDAKSLRFANNYDLYATNIFDFQLSFRLNRFVGGDAEDDTQKLSAQELDQFLHQRVTAFQGRDTWQGTFIDNHDQMRTLVRLQKLGIDETERDRRMDLATVLLMTVRGIPIIFYGDEQYLVYYDDGHNTTPININSDNDDPYNRVGMTRWSEDTPAFKTITTLASLRKDSPAISQGEYVTLYADQDVLVFERRYRQDVVVVAVNRGADKTVVIPKPVDLAPGNYKGILTSASDVNHENLLDVRSDNSSLYLHGLSSLVVWSQQQDQ
ncbi:MAG: hypothetical protein JO235_05350 [Chroococcidiopsidaceae cyanobacterium CP_BM_RX_35]|nr:hypothetical protein [Chroococcidiopsidaceae cyanobacterium CP_BM_RX_35]